LDGRLVATTGSCCRRSPSTLRPGRRGPATRRGAASPGPSTNRSCRIGVTARTAA